MSILDKILRRRQDPPPDPYLGRQKNRTILKAALQNRAPSYKNYVNYAAFPDRIPPTADKETHDQVIRRAVHYTNAQLGIQGLVRSDFSKELNDRLARSAVFSICEKAIIDYFGTAEWEIVDESGKAQTDAMRWLRKPNPHQTLNMVLKEAVRDTIRYDAGVLVNSLRADGTLGEVRAFHGPDWWIEVDRDWTALDGIGSQYYGPWSHGLVRRYWQHSRPGIYIPFDPEEVCYFMLYPRTDSMYGTDFLSRIRWQLEYLIDSTRAAGMTYANGIAPGAVWKHPDYTSIEELAERELDIELNHLGAENFGGIIHLIGNESIESFTPTLHDMQWLEGQKFFTEMVLAMFGFASSEFFQGDVNRATAYIGRNITKSRMLYPLQVAYEQMITEKILPLMEGWDDDWEFRFVDTVDLDDELKRAQINQTRASTASSYAMLGISIESALELAEVPDDLQTAIRESLEDLKDQEGDWTDGLPQELPQEEAEQYYGDPGGEDYRGTAIDGDDAENREDGVQKARTRVYLKPGEEPPAGVQVEPVLEEEEGDTVQKGGRIYVTPKHPAPPGAKLYRGDRGGVFYFGSQGGKGEGMLDPKRPGKGPAGAPSSRGRPTRPPVPGGPRGRDPDRPETRSGVDRFIRRPERQGVESEFRSIDELRTVLASTKYALISAGRNPKREPDEPEETFQKRHEQLRADLAAAGYTYTQVLGSYGDFEDSFLVMAHDADLAPMLELGAKYNQDSIIWADHGTNYMIYTTDSQDDDGNAIAAGSYLKGEGYEEIDLDAGDYFTEVHLSEAGKNARFSLNFDWDTLHPPEDLKGR